MNRSDNLLDDSDANHGLKMSSELPSYTIIHVPSDFETPNEAQLKVRRRSPMHASCKAKK